jgi:ABC-type transporter Mla subunit MlaD
VQEHYNATMERANHPLQGNDNLMDQLNLFEQHYKATTEWIDYQLQEVNKTLLQMNKMLSQTNKTLSQTNKELEGILKTFEIIGVELEK